MSIECLCSYCRKPYYKLYAYQKKIYCSKACQQAVDRNKKKTLDYRYEARKRNERNQGKGVELDIDTYKKMVTSSCVYCGIMPIDTGRLTNGIDRVDNNIWYVESNCVPCCFECNMMKSKLDRDVFLGKVKSIYESLGLDG